MECSRLGLSAVVGGQVVAHWSCLKHQSSIQLGPEDMRRELLQRPHILICSAEFLASEEVNPGHILQPTVLNSGTDGHLCCVIASLLKCENNENELLNVICSDKEPLARLPSLLTWPLKL